MIANTQTPKVKTHQRGKILLLEGQHEANATVTETRASRSVVALTGPGGMGLFLSAVCRDGSFDTIVGVRVNRDPGQPMPEIIVHYELTELTELD